MLGMPQNPIAYRPLLSVITSFFHEIMRLNDTLFKSSFERLEMCSPSKSTPELRQVAGFTGPDRK